MLSNTKRNYTIKKGAHKAVFEQEKLHQIIDELNRTHCIARRIRPMVILDACVARVDDMVYIHGAKNSRLLRGLKGDPTRLTFTCSMVALARSAFHHSAHYRSMLCWGSFFWITWQPRKRSLIEHLHWTNRAGRTDLVRLRDEKIATELLAILL